MTHEQTLNLDALAEQALDAAMRLTDTEFAAIAVLTADGSQLEYRWLSPLAGHPLPAITRAQLCQPFDHQLGVTGEALRRQSYVITEDYQQFPQPLVALAALGVRSVLAYPINCNRYNTAIFVVATCFHARQFSAAHIQFLATIARQFAIALDHHHLLANSHTVAQPQLAHLIQHNADAILVTDDDGCVQFANPAAQTLLGRTLTELRDFPLGLTSHTGRGELDLHRPDGQRVPIELRATVTTWNGQPAHVLTLRDLTQRRRREDAYRATADRLRTALVQTLDAMSRTVETRDPYTAGHQRRVAALARLLAIELALPIDTVEGIYMGGIIHDIGKLYVPEQILTRPGRLSEIEYLLIKTHSTVGRDIIAGIPYPWPLAAMVHQHHERLNGSGYPQGLQGEQIILEARVLAVADVVDAMSSRRPYREARGLPLALVELERGRGNHYDPDIVTACIRLFNQQGLQLADLEIPGNPLLAN